MPLNKTDYSKTVIYKLISKDLNIKDIYVGHTTDFTTRKSKHKHNCNKENAEHYNLKIYKFMRDNGGWENFDMVEIEKYPCNDANEARARERYFYELLNANLNTQYPNRSSSETHKITYQKHLVNPNYKEYMKEYSKQYREKNADALKVKKNTKYNCDCGGSYTHTHKALHNRSKKHLLYCENLKNDIIL